MTPRTAHSTRGRRRRLLLTLATGAALTLGLFSCFSSQPHDPLDANVPAGDDTPFHERQTLEDYAATIPPAIVKFQEQVAKAAGGEWRHDPSTHQFSVTYCVESDKQRGNRVRTVGGTAGPVPLEQLLEIGNDVFAPLGLQSQVGEEYNGGRHLIWTDWHNGGYIRAYTDQSKTTLSGDSECRPSTDPEQIRLELKELVPLPSESPTQSGSSPPSHTRSRPRFAQRRTEHTSTKGLE